MGYSTQFSGEIAIEPALGEADIAKINDFCNKRHENQSDRGYYCDWEVSECGTEIGWNGSEKSYNMEEWMVYLIQNFFQGHILNGTLSAAGEEPADLWLLHVENNVVKVEELNLFGGAVHTIGGDKWVLPNQDEAIALAPPVVQFESDVTLMDAKQLADHFHGFLKDLAGDAPEEAARIFRTIFDGTPITVNKDGTFNVYLDE